MRLVWKMLVLAAVLTAHAVVLAGAPQHGPTTSRVRLPDVMELRPGAFQYRASGEFTRDGKPAPAPLATVRIARPLAIMRHQVTNADYRRCADEGACPVVEGDAAPDHPVVKVSWRDAQAYVSWLSRATAVRFRLPTDQEWAYAAAERRTDDVLPDAAYGDPGRRALALYEAEANRDASIGKQPRPLGSFGANAHGVVDMAGNVWEWTDTCFARVMRDGREAAEITLLNCGVRVVAGRHRSYMPDFIRDARAGGCSVGVQPSNLGFRLVRDDGLRWLRSFPDGLH